MFNYFKLSLNSHSNSHMKWIYFMVKIRIQFAKSNQFQFKGFRPMSTFTKDASWNGALRVLKLIQLFSVYHFLLHQLIFVSLYTISTP